MNETQQLKIQALRNKYVKDNEATTYIDDIEHRLQKVIEESKIAENPIFQAILQDAEKRLNDVNTLLMTDKTLTDVQRNNLFNQKELWTWNIERFGMKAHDQALQLLEQTIDDKLNQ